MKASSSAQGEEVIASGTAPSMTSATLFILQRLRRVGETGFDRLVTQGHRRDT